MISRCAIGVLLGLLAGGCTTIYGGGRQQREARVEMELRNLRAEVERLRDRLDELDAGRQDVYRRVEGIEGDVAGEVRANRQRLDQLEQRVAAVDAARAKDRQAIVDELSREMAKLVNSRAPAPRTVSGVEHVVQPGQTLSEIAAVYGVRTRAIVEANNLTDPNNIRVGQTLFIPE